MPAPAASPPARRSHCRRVSPEPAVAPIASSPVPPRGICRRSRPSFMTRRTRSIAPMSLSGSPSIAIRSARLPRSIVPTMPSMRQASAPHRVPASSASRGETPRRTRVSQLERHEPVHAVGAAREAHARGEVAREVLVDETARPAHLLHDGGAPPVALLDARRVQEDPEGADEPDAALDHQRDVLVRRRARRARWCPRPPRTASRSPGPAVGVGGRVRARALRLLDGGADLLARVGARGRHACPAS